MRDELRRWRKRMAEVPDEGFSEEYRVQLAVGMLYKAIVNAIVARGGVVPPNVRSSGEVKWGNWPVSTGRQQYATQAFKAPVAQPYIKSTAMYQTSGQIHYTHELPVPPRTSQRGLCAEPARAGQLPLRDPSATQATAGAAIGGLGGGPARHT